MSYLFYCSRGGTRAARAGAAGAEGEQGGEGGIREDKRQRRVRQQNKGEINFQVKSRLDVCLQTATWR